MRIHRLLSRRRPQPTSRRRGAFMMLAVFCLVLTIGFVAFSVDIGMISLTRSKMQSSVDAAALAAAMEITHAVETAPPDETDITGYCKEAAAQKAAEVAQLNGYYVDPATDVAFGSRTYDENTQSFVVNWNLGASDPTNIVNVTARKENGDFAQPDAKLRLFFAGIFGDNTASLRTEATAFVEARDIVVVHDFSRSMNFDSYYSDETTTSLSDAQILDNLQTVYNDLQPNLGSLGFTPQHLKVTSTNPAIDVTFKYAQALVESAKTYKRIKLEFTDGNQQTITVTGTTGTYQGSSSHNGKNVSKVWVTWDQEGTGTAVTMSGQNASGCIPKVTITFAADRKSVYVSSTKDLSNVVLRFDDNVDYKFDNLNQGKTGTFQGIGGNTGKRIKRIYVKSGCNSSGDGPGYGERFTHPDPSATNTEEVTRLFEDTNSAVKQRFGLNSVAYPYSGESWDNYIDYVRTNSKLRSKGYAEAYGGLTYVQYVLRYRSSHSQTPALALTQHYPFHAIKLGHLTLCNFLENLGFNDTLGMVSYDTYHRVEQSQAANGSIPAVNISDEPLGINYDAVANLMSYKQANHYYSSTNIGGGMRDAVQLMVDHGRTGARPNIILMTDGNANVTDGDTSLPSGWENWFDGFNGPGSSYDVEHDSPSNSVLSARLSLLHEVHDAVSKGYTIHTIAVGADADWQTMQAIAHYAGGEFLYVPGGTSPEQMESDMMAAFHKIAGLVPPAKLMGADAP